MLRLAPLGFAFSATLAACSTAPQPSEAPVATAVSPSEKAPAKPARATYGSALDDQAPRVALDDLLKEPSRFADRTIRTEGTISAVCQGMGCWLEIGDPKSKAHVKLGGHKFFVPKDSAGKHAEVEARVLPAVDDGHCESEAAEQTGKVAKVELLASGVELF